MERLAKLLHLQQLVIVSGSNPEDLYSLLEYLLDAEWKKFIKRHFSRPLFLFTSRDGTPFCKSQSGDYHRLHCDETRNDISSIYYPLSNNLLPAGTLFLFLTDYNAIEQFMEEKYGQIYPLKLVWIQTFPYSQEDSILKLEYLRDSITWTETAVCLLKTGRRYGATDIGDEEHAREYARQAYFTREFVQAVFLFEVPLTRQNWFDFASGSYLQSVLFQDVKKSIQIKWEQYREDFDSKFINLSGKMLDDPCEIDKLFSYRSWKKTTSKTVAECWSENLHWFFMERCRNNFIALIEDFLDPVSLEDDWEQTQQLLDEEWMKFIQNLNYRKQVSWKPDPTKVSELEFDLKIGENKKAWRAAFVNWIEIQLRDSIKQYIEIKFLSRGKPIINHES